MDAAPHRFRLERIRTLRERAEDQAKQALAESLSRQQDAEARAAAAGDGVGAARAAIAAAATQPFDGASLLAHQAYLEQAEARHRASLDACAGHLREVETTRASLVEAARARQSLDRLHERSLAAHRLESGRRERAELDEIALNTFRRNAA